MVRQASFKHLLVCVFSLGAHGGSMGNTIRGTSGSVMQKGSLCCLLAVLSEMVPTACWSFLD